MNRGVVATLRDCVPLRPLLRTEALRIAELQASKFLALVELTKPPVPKAIITELPRLQVAVMRPFPVSGATSWRDGRWMIVLNGREPETRQRFSLAHEFKHILDDRFVDLIYRHVAASDRHGFAEQVCDYFAGCLLMPRPWIKRLFFTETQGVKELAHRFEVSEAAIETRLSQIGLVDPRPRCSRIVNDRSLRPDRKTGSPRYLRELHPAFAAGALA